MEFNLADLFENAVDHFPDRECLVVDDERRTYADMERRSNRLAHHLAEVGIGRNDHVGIYARNCVEWVETMWALFKLRAVPININFRYSAPELQYLFDNADLVGLVFQRKFAPLVAECRPSLPLLRHLIAIDDESDGDPTATDAVAYEDALAGGSPERDFEPRSGEDRYILYTGGTTGLPKGVVWRHDDQFMAFGGRGDTTLKPGDVASRAAEGPALTTSSFAPLMHNNGQWVTMGAAFTGNKAVLMSKFDALSAWRLVERERVNMMGLVGDAMARPLLDVLRDPTHEFDLSSLTMIASGGATLSPSAKAGFLELLPDVMLMETIGSTESGPEGTAQVTADSPAASGTRVTISPGTIVVDDELRPVEVGEVGKIARSGFLPIGYYKDEQKTRSTFVEIDGVRYVIPGDFARVEGDGSLTMLGRGSVVINTGGEKVHPEEVEAVLKSHPDVVDATVVGVPDERWGQSVGAVLKVRDGAAVSIEAVKEHCLPHLAPYKVPRSLHLVDEFQRHESGKPDYRWAAKVVAGDA